MSLDYTYARGSGANQTIISNDQVYTLLKHGQKQPQRPEWQNKPVSLTDFDPDRNNLGLLLGERTGFVDVDCDCPEAVHMAGYLLPEPAGFFQRKEGSAHYIYRCDNPEKTERLDFGGTIVELRGTGGQTMIPPSVHPEGETLSWALCEPEAAPVEFSDLQVLVNLMAAGVVIIREYAEGKRHSLTLGLAGLLRKAGVSEVLARSVISGIAEWHGDEEDRLHNVKTTYAQPLDKVAGYRMLEEYLQPESLTKVCTWLGIQVDLPVLTGEILQPLDRSFGAREITVDTISEAAIAEHFAPALGGRFCFVPEEKGWRYWDGRRWVSDDRRSLSRDFMEFIKALSAQTTDRYLVEEFRKFETAYRAESVAKLCQSSCAVEANRFDRDAHLLNCWNGVVDLHSGALRCHDPLAYPTKLAWVEHDPEAEAERFEQFVLEICSEDRELVAFLQRIMGYALLGENPEQVLFVLHGNGANGKSTLVEVISEVLGDYARTAPSSVLVDGRTGGVGDDLVYLKGARLITASETGVGVPLAESKVKQITGGDTTSGRVLYGAYQEFCIDGLLLFSTNHLPRISGTDDGIWRRINVIEFKRQFSERERDPHLKKKLLEERSGILNWMLAGYADYEAGGLQVPESVQRSNRAYRGDMDIVGQFLEDRCVFEPDSRTSKPDMRRAFEWWCGDHGRKDVPHGGLKDALEQREVRAVKINGTRYWKGVSLNSAF